MVKISKDMLINDILAVDAGNAAILMAAGMHCIGCLAAAGESLEEAAAVHGLDAEELEQEIIAGFCCTMRHDRAFSTPICLQILRHVYLCAIWQ